MPKVQVVDASGKKVAQRELAPEVFDARVSVPLMHQVVVAGMAAIRRGTHATKTRGDVSGGGRKPWRQKGTGRARQGSIRAPQWSGGGVAHGPHPRDHSMRVNKKMKRGALRSALTDALTSGKVSVVDELSFDEPKTRRAAEVIEALELEGAILLVLPRPSSDGIVERSFRNLASVRVAYVPALAVYEVLAADRVLFTQRALDVLEGGTQPAQATSVEAPGKPPAKDAGEADA
jgi:large subunit ribosomal protein L4